MSGRRSRLEIRDLLVRISELAKAGYSARGIGAHLNVCRDTILGLCWRNGLSIATLNGNASGGGLWLQGRKQSPEHIAKRTASTRQTLEAKRSVDTAA